MGKHEPRPSPPSSVASPEKTIPIHRSIPIRMIDSFRRDPNQIITSTGEIVDLKLDHGHGDSYDAETAISNTAKSPLARSLQVRHLQMIAIGGSIGASEYFPARLHLLFLTLELRNWPICRIWKSSRSWWPSVFADSIRAHQPHAVLHGLRFGRNELLVSYCRQL